MVVAVDTVQTQTHAKSMELEPRPSRVSSRDASLAAVIFCHLLSASFETQFEREGEGLRLIGRTFSSGISNRLPVRCFNLAAGKNA